MKSSHALSITFIIMCFIGCSSEDKSTPSTLNPENSSGSFDKTFSNDGVMNTNFGSDYSNVTSACIQTDDKIIVAGTARYFNGVTKFALARLNKDGTLDSTFGNNGKTTTSIANGSSSTSGNFPLTVGLLPNGKIIAAGQSIDNEFAIAKYNTDGSIDTSFGSGGVLIENIETGAIPTHKSRAQSIYVQDDGKFILAGISVSNSTNKSVKLVLVRYNEDGSHDPGFGLNGISLMTIADNAPANTASNSFLIKIAKDNSSGKLVVATNKIYSGLTPTEINIDNFSSNLFRFNTNGMPDNSFGNSGRKNLSNDVYVSELLNTIPFCILNSEKYIVCGDKILGNQIFNPTMSSYIGMGIPNSGFSDSISTISFPNIDGVHISDIQLQSDGQIILTLLAVQTSVSKNIYLCRLNPDGSFDQTFGYSGKVITSVNGTGQVLLIDSNDKINVIFNGFTDDFQSNNNFGVLRLNP